MIGLCKAQNIIPRQHSAADWYATTGLKAGSAIVIQPIGLIRTRVELKLLLDLARPAVPDDGRFVDAATQQQVAALVPLEREDRALVRVQDLLQLACMVEQELW